MATITEIREKLRLGEVIVLSGKSLQLFMSECSRHPVGDECYQISPHSRGHSKVYEPRRVKVEEIATEKQNQ